MNTLPKYASADRSQVRKSGHFRWLHLHGGLHLTRVGVVDPGVLTKRVADDQQFAFMTSLASIHALQVELGSRPGRVPKGTSTLLKTHFATTFTTLVHHQATSLRLC